MPYVQLRRPLAAMLVAGLLLVITAAPAGARPFRAGPPARDGRPVAEVSEGPPREPGQERPGRGLTGLLAVVATVCVLGVTAAAIRTIHAQRSIGTMTL